MAIFQDGLNGIYLYFVNKHLSSWDFNPNIKLVFYKVENIVGKGENAVYQHFLLFPQCFQKDSFSGSLKVGIVR